MAVIGLDLGGTKLAAAVFDHFGNMQYSTTYALSGRMSKEVGLLICETIGACISQATSKVEAVGVAVPGISRSKQGTVWAPNIGGWDDYPLLEEVKNFFPGLPVVIESDRACYIMGEHWKGSASSVRNAIFLSFGTGIGAGILVDGKILRGAHDIAGAIGWWALGHPFDPKYIPCGFFEHHASGEGLRKVAAEKRAAVEMNFGPQQESGTTAAIFDAYSRGERWAVDVIGQAVMYWGMASANLISIFDPEMIIFGGGVFGPATPLISEIQEEATKWAQPVAAKLVTFAPSALGGNAGVYGAGRFALDSLLDK
jgi:glucokinase